MGFPALPAVRHEKQCLLLLTCVIAVFAVSASAQTDMPDATPDQPATEAGKSEVQKEVTGSEIPPEKDLKKLAKYDVERIGRRGIGRGFNLYSARRERQLGQSVASSFDHSTKLITDPVVNDYINRLGQKIARNSDADVAFTVKIIDAGEIPRAYGLPGGFLYVDSALVLAADNEAELAAVMAHEIAHVAARHATRALTRKNICRIAASMALFAGPPGVMLNDASGIAGPLSVKKFNRDAEYEADLLGIEYSYAAGYDPEALLSALEKLHAMELKRVSVFSRIPGANLGSKVPFHGRLAKSFASYPLTEERIQRLQSEIAAFLPDRKDYILDTNEFQEVKSRLLASDTPTLRRHRSGEDDPKGPVLRRSPSSEPDEQEPGSLRASVAMAE